MATNETIDHFTLTRLVEAGAVSAVHAIGQAGGWEVIIKCGVVDRALTAQRSHQVRLFKKMETLVSYLKDVGITRFDVDAANYSPATSNTAHKKAHLATPYDEWFYSQVELGIKEADDPNTHWVSHDEAKASWAAKRTALAKRIEGQ